MGGLPKLALIRSLDRDLAIMRYNHFENALTAILILTSFSVHCSSNNDDDNHKTKAGNPTSATVVATMIIKLLLLRFSKIIKKRHFLYNFRMLCLKRIKLH